MTLTLDGQLLPLEVIRPGLGRATLTASAPGKFPLVATATDADGATRQVETFLPRSAMRLTQNPHW